MINQQIFSLHHCYQIQSYSPVFIPTKLNQTTGTQTSSFPFQTRYNLIANLLIANCQLADCQLLIQQDEPLIEFIAVLHANLKWRNYAIYVQGLPWQRISASWQPGNKLCHLYQLVSMIQNLWNYQLHTLKHKTSRIRAISCAIVVINYGRLIVTVRYNVHVDQRNFDAFMW